MRRVLVDSSAVLYAVGAEHPLRTPCRTVLENPSITICAGVELVQEVVFHRMRVSDRTSAVRLDENWAQVCRLYLFDWDVLTAALF